MYELKNILDHVVIKANGYFSGVNNLYYEILYSYLLYNFNLVFQFNVRSFSGIDRSMPFKLDLEASAFSPDQIVIDKIDKYLRLK